jgi:signal transduction histidine kinase
VILTLAVGFAVVYRQTGSELRAQLDRTLRSAAIGLATSATDGLTREPGAVLAAARRYAATQPYRNAAILLFAVVPGVGQVSNHPELIDPVGPDDRESAAEQAVENRDALRLARPHAGYTDIRGPDIGRLRVFQQRVPIAGGRYLYAAAAEPMDGVESAQDGVLRSFALGGVLAVLVALVAASLTGSRIAAPLRRLSLVAARVDAGDLTPRIALTGANGTELQVLGDAFNHMLDRLQAAFASQRAFLADASHELRTPITVIRGQLDLLAGDGPPAREEFARSEQMIKTEIARLSRVTDELLLLARADRSDFLRREPVALRAFVEELWDGLSLTADRSFVVQDVPDITISADPDRLAQALRNLAVNAVAHTTEPDGLVQVSGELVGARVRITVTDDGPGVPAAEREAVFERFHRAGGSRSQASGGAGLGLAIVRAIVTAHGGAVWAAQAPGGGAAFVVELPW